MALRTRTKVAGIALTAAVTGLALYGMLREELPAPKVLSDTWPTGTAVSYHFPERKMLHVINDYIGTNVEWHVSNYNVVRWNGTGPERDLNVRITEFDGGKTKVPVILAFRFDTKGNLVATPEYSQ